MSVILRPDFPSRPRPIPISGTNEADVERAVERLTVAHALFASLVKISMEDVINGLPVTRTSYLRARLEGFLDDLFKMNADLLGDLKGARVERE